MRRYGLLFSVNGGAFVIVSALAKLDFGSNPPIDPRYIALGTMLFTLLMFFDILFYGLGMKRLEESWVEADVIPEGPNTPEGQSRLFGPVGVVILICLILLIITGWALAAHGVSGKKPDYLTWTMWGISLVAVPSASFVFGAIVLQKKPGALEKS